MTPRNLNIEQLLHAGLHTQVLSTNEQTFTPEQESLLAELAERSLAAYAELKNDPHFGLSLGHKPAEVLRRNQHCRPSKRSGGKLTLESLRAIPFVGAWSQIKQNVPGFYGLGAAIEQMKDRLDEIKEMYAANLFFKTLMDNCEMAMLKCLFPLTAFLAEDEKYGCIWKKIHDEYERCRRMVAEISGSEELMFEYPVEQQSVLLREKIVLPLVTIQQYGLTRLRALTDAESDLRETLEKLVIRCSFGIINAGRNSA